MCNHESKDLPWNLIHLVGQLCLHIWLNVPCIKFVFLQHGSGISHDLAFNFESTYLVNLIIIKNCCHFDLFLGASFI